MPFFKFFQPDRNRKLNRERGTRRHICLFERLEDRTLLTANLSEFTAEFSETGISGETIATATGPGIQAIQTFDQDDFYMVYSEQVQLLRAAEEVLISIDPQADPTEVIIDLTEEGGALEGFEISQFN
jgi:hypothetical protein